MRETKKILQWHPAFYAGLQIELAEEAGNLVFENEHTLSTKPMQIDVLIIKKNTEQKIQKNIGQIFRRHNIIEYKSPEDVLSVDDFYKVYGYACFYKSDTGKADEVEIRELTLTFVCYHYPEKMMRHLERTRGFSIEEMDAGIYYIIGDMIPMQLIVVPRLSRSNNLWLYSLTDKLGTDQEAEDLLCAYKEHENENLYQSVMDIIVRSNIELFQEDGKMCDALMELMKDKFEERERIASEETIMSLIQKKLKKGKSLSVIADELEETEEAIRPLYDRVKTEQEEQE